MIGILKLNFNILWINWRGSHISIVFVNFDNIIILRRTLKWDLKRSWSRCRLQHLIIIGALFKLLCEFQLNLFHSFILLNFNLTTTGSFTIYLLCGRLQIFPVWRSWYLPIFFTKIWTIMIFVDYVKFFRHNF